MKNKFKKLLDKTNIIIAFAYTILAILMLFLPDVKSNTILFFIILLNVSVNQISNEVSRISKQAKE